MYRRTYFERQFFTKYHLAFHQLECYIPHVTQRVVEEHGVLLRVQSTKQEGRTSLTR